MNQTILTLTLALLLTAASGCIDAVGTTPTPDSPVAPFDQSHEEPAPVPQPDGPEPEVEPPAEPVQETSVPLQPQELPLEWTLDQNLRAGNVTLQLANMSPEPWTLEIGNRTINGTGHPVVVVDAPGWTNLTLRQGNRTATTQYEFWGQPHQWGEPTGDKWLRPGVNHIGCTINFLYEHKDYRYFAGTAHHCVSDTARCAGPVDEEIGNPNRIYARPVVSTGGESFATEDTWLAYSSGLAMQEADESDTDVCVGNDFALLELGPEALAFAHPAVLTIGGPTSLGPTTGLASGSMIHGYGGSTLRPCVDEAPCDAKRQASDIKHGAVVGMERSNWIYRLYTHSPGIFGDSGSGMMGPEGQAIGVASTIQIAPLTASNAFTNVAMALEYMENHEGWAPELVTWDTFEPFPGGV